MFAGGKVGMLGPIGMMFDGVAQALREEQKDKQTQ